VIGQRLAEIVSEEPADAQAISGHLHELSLTANVLKEHDQLQAKEDDRVDAGSAPASIQRAHQVSDEGEVEGLLQAAVEVVRWDEVLQRNVVW
jgi:hypothetical protein